MWGQQHPSQEEQRLRQTPALWVLISPVTDTLMYWWHKIYMQEYHWGEYRKMHFLGNINEAGVYAAWACAFSILALYCLFYPDLPLQKSCHHFIWTQLFSPLANDLSSPAGTEESLHIFHCIGWKLVSSRGTSCQTLTWLSHTLLPANDAHSLHHASTNPFHLKHATEYYCPW